MPEFAPPPGANEAMRQHLVHAAEIARRTGVTKQAVSLWIARHRSIAELVITWVGARNPVFWWPQVDAELNRLGLPGKRPATPNPSTLNGHHMTDINPLKAHAAYINTVADALEKAGVAVECWHADPNEPRDGAATLASDEDGQRVAGWDEESGWMYGTGPEGEGLALIWWISDGVLPDPGQVVTAVQACLAGDYTDASINRPYYRSFEEDDDLDEQLAAYHSRA